VAGAIGFWLALGSPGGLYWLAFYLVPGLGSFHDPARFLLWTTVAISILTAVGMDAIQVRRRLNDPRLTAGILVAVVLPLVWFSSDWLPTTDPGNLDRKPSAIGEIHARLGDKRAVLPSNLLYWKRIVSDGYVDYGSGESDAIQRTADTLVSNLDMKNKIESASGYEPVPVANHVEMEGIASLAQVRREPLQGKILQLEDVGLLLSQRTGGTPVVGFREEKFGKGRATPLAPWDRTSTVHRSWMVRTVTRIEGRLRIAAALTAPNFDPYRTGIVSGSPAMNLGVPSTLPSGLVARVEPCESRATASGRIVIHGDAGNAPALLVYSGTAYPGWKATVDGRKAAIVCTDGALIGIPIGPGKHRVVLTFAPDVFRIGSFVTLMSIMVLSAIILSTFIVRRYRILVGSN